MIQLSFFCIFQVEEIDTMKAMLWNHRHLLENQIFLQVFQFPTKCHRDYLQKEQGEVCNRENFYLHDTIKGFAGFRRDVPTQNVVS